MNPRIVAMKHIVDKCKDVFEVKLLKVKFFEELSQAGIMPDGFDFDTINHRHNVVDIKTIECLKVKAEESKYKFDEQLCRNSLSMFSKINHYRNGKNNAHFEKIGYILMTENKAVLSWSFDLDVNLDDIKLGFARNIDFIISKFWFKLNKGFQQGKLPHTFNFVTKARIVLANKVSHSITKSFDVILKNFNSGKMSESEAIELNRELRSKPILPEQITADNVEDTLSFLDLENFSEDFFREKFATEKLISDLSYDKEELLKEVEKYKELEREQSRLKNIIELGKLGDDYAKTQWDENVKILKSNILYFLKSIFISSLPIIISILIKFVPSIYDYVCNLPYFIDIFLLVGLIIWTVYELYYRVFFVNKKQIIDGWQALKCIFKINSIKKTKMEQFKSEYIDIRIESNNHS